MSEMQDEIAEAADGRPAQRTFTLAEANRALVLVRRIVGDVIDEYASLLDLQEALEAAENDGDAERYEETRLGLIRSAGRLRTCLAEIDDVGAELKDWSLGVVDFPCVAGGRQVCLTWLFGRDRIEHWHELDVGFASLHSIETLPAAGRYAARKGEPTAGPRTSKGPKTRLPRP